MLHAPRSCVFVVFLFPPFSQFNPLSFWSFEDCWTYLRRHNAPYHPLHDVGFSSLGDMQSTRKVCVPAASIQEDTAAVWRVLRRSAAAILCCAADGNVFLEVFSRARRLNLPFLHAAPLLAFASCC